MQKPTILIVDDNKINTEILFLMLKDIYNLRIARNGEECLKRSIIKPYPDLILLDVMMPVLDGFETIRLLKRDERIREIPVIFLTALSNKDDVIKGFELGAVDYLVKPFNITELKARLRTHLDLKLSRQQIRVQKQDLEMLNERLQDRIAEQRIFIENARLLQASLIQKEIPLLSEFNIQALYLPSEDLGGDFFSIVKGVHEHKLVIMLGDCTGHGLESSIESSLLTSIVRKMMFNLFKSNDTGMFLKEVNREFIKVAEADQFPTMFLCIIDLDTKILKYSNANGVLPSLLRDGRIFSIEPVNGMHLGYSVDTRYESISLQLEEDDRLYFYSDAVLEYETVRYDFSGRECFEKILNQKNKCPSDDFRSIIREFERTSGRLPLEDDTTLIQLDYSGTMGRSYTFSSLSEYESILTEIKSCLRRKDYPEDEISGISIGLDELCMNAFQHGNKEEPDRIIELTALISCRSLSFTVTDMGDGFNPLDVPDPVDSIIEIYESDKMDEYMHGRGIAVARTFYDTIEYNEKGNSVCLRKAKKPETVVFSYEKEMYEREGI
ncbi:MAG: SpoIIE family protein phosphatase [Spirochaetales bacterium]|nr:SpoIIE family protein phosphatase [Spirochaetales bacterium]